MDCGIQLVTKAAQLCDDDLRKRTFTSATQQRLDAPLSLPFRFGVWTDAGIRNISFTVMREVLKWYPERWDVFGNMMRL